MAQSEPAERAVPRHVEAAIERKRGGGQGLDGGARTQMESAFGVDFSGVRVHTDNEAGSLNRAVNAVAFTVGRDIFFSEGSYNTGSSDGRHLLSHELTHVVQQGGNSAGGNLVLSEQGDRSEQEAETVAKQVPGGAVPLRPREATDGDTIWRFEGKADFIKTYDITGDISGGGLVGTPIIGLNNTAYILAGSSGELTINLEGKAIGKTSGFIKGGIVLVSFSLEHQKIPYKCTPEGEVTIETASVSPGHTEYDSSSMNPVGSDIGVAIGTSIDAAANPKFVIEQISFTAGGGGIQVSVSKGPVSVGGPTLGGAGSESTTVPIRFDFQIVGKRPAKPATPPPSASATASSGASSSATITGSVPAHVTVPSPHSIYFKNEAQTEGDEGELVRWADSLPKDVTDAIRTGRLKTTVIGYASTTGTNKANFDRYSSLRAQWVQRILAHAVGVDVKALDVGWKGSYTAPPADQSHPGGVANPHERRADIMFAETNPVTPVTATASSSAGSTATAHTGP